WEGLLRALRAGSARLEEAGDVPDGAVRTKGIEPQPVPLNLKVVLIGNEELYEALLTNDDRFAKLFKIKAHMTETVERTAADIRSWLIRVAGIIDETHLLPFSRTALAGLVDFSSRVAEDQRKLSLKFPLMRDVMIEASAMAAMKQSALVEAEHLEEALEARMYRANLVEELYMEEYDRELIKVRTSGSAVGRVNGLSVSWYGDFEFGLPHQISCTVGVGHGGIIDLSARPSLAAPSTQVHAYPQELSCGPVRPQQAACDDRKPVFRAELRRHRSDSASGAELAALLSALSGVPLKLSSPSPAR
ncbi:MAG: Lon-insertion domain-containing protein, partial [Bilophila wadsworthia]